MFYYKPSFKKVLSLIFSLLFFNPITAQNITIQPYLQDAGPHTISILWGTDGDEESIVEWGLTDSLGNKTIGITDSIVGPARVHEVSLENLERFTKYYYRVKTGAVISEVFHFKTPPFASDHQPFRIVAMSDMQKDNANPDKFQEVVEEGVLQYLEEKFGGDLVDNLALVMIPGDLVVTGTNLDQWKNDFFNPSEKLLSYVPVYPVLGNHEGNSPYFFTYFKLPENGTPDFEEHWWYKDYANVRIIGLNSNGPFDSQEQLDWLQNLLDNSCSADSIDFVFAQLHHPHKSELWTPGASDFTGEVISLLEQFTTDCGKPSIHLFGHTHGYSRGQSRDHKHLWINVATAGGAIDNWGEFSNFDYDEFSVSQDEYGFVMVEITNDDDPKLLIKRINRGDELTTLDNYVSDSVGIRLNPSEVNIPQPIYPMNEEVIPECVTLMAGDFSAPNIEATHGQTHWQVTDIQNGFNNPIVESWRNFENWYYEINTQEGDDLTDEDITRLEAFSSYLWRVRYRDKEMNWSDWTEPASFTTSASNISPNLLVNSGAENDLENWEIESGIVEALEAQICDGVNPHSGNKYFVVGGLCEHSDEAIAFQNVDVSSYMDSIDAPLFSVNFGGYLSNFSGTDLPEMKVVFLDETEAFLGESSTLSTLNSSWTLLSVWTDIPPLTRTIRLELKGTRNGGTDNDSYFDDLFVKVGKEETNCSTLNGLIRPNAPYVSNLKITPNPMETTALVHIPKSVEGNIYLQMTDLSGQKIRLPQNRQNQSFVIKRGNLKAGTYVLWLRDENKIIGKAKLVVVK